MNSSILISVIAIIISVGALSFTVWYDLNPGDIVYSAPGKVYLQNTGPNSYNVVVPVTWENTGGKPLVVNHIHLLVYDGGENATAFNNSTDLYRFNILGEYDNLIISNFSTAIATENPKMDSEFIIAPHDALLEYLIFEPPENFTYKAGHTYYFIINCRNNNNTFEGEQFNITNFQITSNPPIGEIIPYKTG